MNFCPNCGERVSGSSSFCPNCGTPLSAFAASVAEGPGGTTSDERLMAVFCHLGGLLGWGFPFGSIIVPLVIWLVKRRESAYIDHHGKEALNFQITLFLAGIVFFVLWVVLFMTMIFAGSHLSERIFAFFPLLVFPLWIGVVLVVSISAIIASVRANNGILWRYPICIRLVR